LRAVNYPSAANNRFSHGVAAGKKGASSGICHAILRLLAPILGKKRAKWYTLPCFLHEKAMQYAALSHAFCMKKLS